MAERSCSKLKSTFHSVALRLAGVKAAPFWVVTLSGAPPVLTRAR